MNLFEYWLEEKIKPAFAPSPKKLAVAAVVLAITFFYLGQSFKQEPLPGFKQLEKLPAVKLPEVVLVTPGVTDTDSAGVEKTRLKIISANLIGIYEQTPNPGSQTYSDPGSSDATENAKAIPSASPTLTPNPLAPKLTGIRILGEVKNVGQETAFGAKAIVRFYGQSTPGESASATPGVTGTGSPGVELLATKIAQFNQGYKFLPLGPEEVNVYDLIVPNPPESETVTIEMRTTADSPKEAGSLDGSQALKIKEKSLEPVSIKKGKQKLSYYKFSGILVNKSQQEIVNPGLYLWLKNDQGKVIGLAGKIFEADLLMPDQELEVKLIVFPVSSEEVFNFEIKTFAERL